MSTLEACTLPHCNLLVRDGNLGLLAVRQRPSGSSATALPAPVSELAQLLGVYQDALRQAQAEPSCSASGNAEESLPGIGARFKGMQAAFASTSPRACQLAQRTGLTVCPGLCVGQPPSGDAGQQAAGGAPGAAAADGKGAEAASTAIGAASGATAGERKPVPGSLRLPDAAEYAAKAAAELGAAEGTSGRDLLLLHFDAPDLMASCGRGAAAGAGAGAGAGSGTQAAAAAAFSDSDAVWDSALETLEWLDALIKSLLANPAIRERTLLVLMLSPSGQPVPSVQGASGPSRRTGSSSKAGTVLQPGGASIDPSAAVLTPHNAGQVGLPGVAAAVVAAASRAGGGTGLAVLDADDLPMVTRPVQSYQLLGMDTAAVDEAAPVLVVRRLPGVVRRDRAEALGYREAVVTGSQGAILVDRLLPEVAYKLARAPKYGA